MMGGPPQGMQYQQYYGEEEDEKGQSCCRRMCKMMCCCSMLGVIVLAGLFYWLQPVAPTVDLEPKSFKPQGFLLDSKTMRMVFRAEMSLKIDNPNVFGATVSSKSAEIWYYRSKRGLMESKYFYLGNAELEGTVPIKAQSSVTVPVKLQLEGQGEPSSVLMSLVSDCNAKPVSVPLMINVSHLTAQVLGTFALELSQVKFNTTLDDCTPQWPITTSPKQADDDHQTLLDEKDQDGLQGAQEIQEAVVDAVVDAAGDVSMSAKREEQRRDETEEQRIEKKRLQGSQGAQETQEAVVDAHGDVRLRADEEDSKTSLSATSTKPRRANPTVRRHLTPQ